MKISKDYKGISFDSKKEVYILCLAISCAVDDVPMVPEYEDTEQVLDEIYEMLFRLHLPS